MVGRSGEGVAPRAFCRCLVVATEDFESYWRLVGWTAWHKTTVWYAEGLEMNAINEMFVSTLMIKDANSPEVTEKIVDAWRRVGMSSVTAGKTFEWVLKISQLLEDYPRYVITPGILKALEKTDVSIGDAFKYSSSDDAVCIERNAVFFQFNLRLNTAIECIPVVSYLWHEVFKKTVPSTVSPVDVVAFLVILKPDSLLLFYLMPAEDGLSAPLPLMLRDTSKYGTKEDIFFRRTRKLFTALALYLGCENADLVLGENSPEYLKAVKELKRFPPGHKKRKEPLATINRLKGVTLVGSRIRILDRHEKERTDHQGGTHARPHPHWRRGHIRRQHYGPGGEKVKSIYIAPTGVCMPEGPYKPGTYRVR